MRYARALVCSVFVLTIPAVREIDVASGKPARCRTRSPSVEALGTPLPEPVWRTLPPGPIDGRSQPSVVWTGREVIVWGGEDGPDGPPQTDGVAYNPGYRTWRRLANSPLAPRSERVAHIWTGREVIVWGGRGGTRERLDAGAYDPSRDRWRRLPRAPISPTENAVAVWTGEEMVVWNGVAGGAAYEPCGNRWRRIAPVPLEGRFCATAVWTGTKMLVWGGNDDNNFPVTEGAAYDPARDEWRPLPPAPVRGYYCHTAVWTGDEMVVWGWSNLSRNRAAENETVAYDPESDSWRTLPRAPFVPPPIQTEGTGGQSAAWAGDRMLAWSGTLDADAPLALALEPVSATWARLPRAPGQPAWAPEVVWTGRQFIVLGAGPNGEALALRVRE